MARKKLLDFRTRKIKDWNLSKSALKKFAKSRPKVDKPQKIRARRTAVKARQIRRLPSEIEFKHLVRPEFFWNRYFGKAHLKYRVRKNQKDLSPIEWQRFIYAIEALADSDMPSPTFQDFVEVHRDAMHHHIGMTWKAHRGINFLTWHREYLVKLEARLMAINPLVTIPYWNWIEDRDIPEALNNPRDFDRWGISRGNAFNGSTIATREEYNALMAIDDFETFSTALEVEPFHNLIHNLVGGTMRTTGSPADPIFWLHHAFVDKLFADWQIRHRRSYHPDMEEVLQPAPYLTRTNSQVWSIRRLKYIYG